jgi:hypothetical protein
VVVFNSLTWIVLGPQLQAYILKKKKKKKKHRIGIAITSWRCVVGSMFVNPKVLVDLRFGMIYHTHPNEKPDDETFGIGRRWT